MNCFLRIWKKALTLLVAGSTSIFIAACYGPPSGLRFMGNWIIRARTASDAPIKGLAVQLMQYSGDNPNWDSFTIDRTDSTGSVEFPLEIFNSKDQIRFVARIHDTDGVANGGPYRDTVLQKGSLDSTIVILPQ